MRIRELLGAVGGCWGLLKTAGSCWGLVGAGSGAPVNKAMNKNLTGSEPGLPEAGSGAPVNKTVNENLTGSGRGRPGPVLVLSSIIRPLLRI